MPPEPEFLLLVASTPSGVAGHHYSVRDIARAMAGAGLKVELGLVVNRPGQVSRALQETPHKRIDAGFCYRDAIDWVRRRLACNPSLVVFGYDELSVRVAIAATVRERHRVVSVKPGWINSAAWSNGVANFVLFTRENLDFYAAHPRYAGIALHYLPNRVARPVPAPDAAGRLTRLLPDLGRVEQVIFCPVRLGWGKDFIVDQALRLHRHLRDTGLSVGLVIAGSVHDESYVAALRERIGAAEDVWVTTDRTLTGNISSYMHAFDMVIGAGRTSGEALCLGKRVFCPNPSGGLPVEITSRSFEGLAYSNFTGRIAAAVDDAAAGDLDAIVAERLGVEAGVPRYRRIASDALQARLPQTRALGTWASTAIRLAAIYAKLHWTGLRGQPAVRPAAAEGA